MRIPSGAETRRNTKAFGLTKILPRACALLASPRLILLLTVVATAAGAAPFRVYQFVPRGAASSRLQCEPRRLEILPFADYAKGRWAAPRGLRLLDKDCIADAAEVINGRVGLAFAAIRVADEPPRAAILDLSPKAPPSTFGWPAPIIRRRSGADGLRPAPRGDPSMLRVAAVCWPSVEAWPVPADREGSEALGTLEPKNQCEWWMLPFKQARGSGELEPDLDGRSYLIVANSRDEWDGQFNARLHWPALFTGQDLNIQEALEAGWDKVPTANEASLWTSAGAMSGPDTHRDARAALTAPPVPVRAGALPPCAPDVDKTHEKVFARFAAWADKFGLQGGQGASEGGQGAAWDPARWQGRCGAYEVLRSALEETLACKLDAGACAR